MTTKNGERAFNEYFDKEYPKNKLAAWARRYQKERHWKTWCESRAALVRSIQKKSTALPNQVTTEGEEGDG